MILHGVTVGNGAVGNGAVVAAGAVVIWDVPDYAVVAGVPARIVRYRFDEETIEGLTRLEWWNWPIGRLRGSAEFFRTKGLPSVRL